jgi:Fe2+ transport system protein FeoA
MITSDSLSYFRLSMACVGANLRVVSLPRDPVIQRKFIDIGLNPGAQIRLDQQSQGMVLIQRGNSRCALSLALAHKIVVQPMQPSPTEPASDGFNEGAQ